MLIKILSCSAQFRMVGKAHHGRRGQPSKVGRAHPTGLAVVVIEYAENGTVLLDGEQGAKLEFEPLSYGFEDALKEGSE